MALRVKFCLLLTAQNMTHFRSNIQSPESGRVNGYCGQTTIHVLKHVSTLSVIFGHHVLNS